jgi:predicted kinase
MMPTLFLLCGLPGSGKTTIACTIESEANALRLTPDDWIVPLYGPEICDPINRDQWDQAHERVEKLQWVLGERALILGIDVVLDFGVWSRTERDRFRARARELGARSELIYLDVDDVERWARVQKRNSLPGTEYIISELEMSHWAAAFEPPSEEELAPWE